MQVTLEQASREDRIAADGLIHNYIDTMAQYINDGPFSDEQQADAVALMNAYWEKEDHYPYLIFCDNELAGFSLVRRYPADKQLFDMGQFFVANKFKRSGVGREALRLTLAKFPGDWIVRILVDNVPAFGFWKKVIAEATQDNFNLSLELDKSLQMHFFRFTV